jgi:hypothetical protein
MLGFCRQTKTAAPLLDESEYKKKLKILLESGVNESLPKDPTAKVEFLFVSSSL